MKTYEESPWWETMGARENETRNLEVLHNIKLCPHFAVMLFQKTRKHKKIEPWAVSTKKSENTQNQCKKINSLSQSFARNSDSLREVVLQIARSSDSLARRCFPDRAKLYTARAKKQDSCVDSRAEESSRAAQRESSREDSEARAKVNDLARNSDKIVWTVRTAN